MKSFPLSKQCLPYESYESTEAPSQIYFIHVNFIKTNLTNSYYNLDNAI